jgi:hypothetical protein
MLSVAGKFGYGSAGSAGNRRSVWLRDPGNPRLRRADRVIPACHDFQVGTALLCITAADAVAAQPHGAGYPCRDGVVRRSWWRSWMMPPVVVAGGGHADQRDR